MDTYKAKLLKELLSGNGLAGVPTTEVMLGWLKEAISEANEHLATRNPSQKRLKTITQLTHKFTTGLVAHGVVDGEQPKLKITVSANLLAAILSEWALPAQSQQ